MHLDMVYQFPIWAVSLLVVGLSISGAVIVELVARRAFPIEARRQNNDVAAAMFSVIGVTFAVLLAFVVMLTFEGFMSARVAAASEASAARDVAAASDGLAEPSRAAVLDALSAYLHDVIEREWPAQAGGHVDDFGSRPLHRLDRIAREYRPDGAGQVDDHAALLTALARLQDTRATRQLAAGARVPPIVWVVMLLGGALTVAAGSFVAAPSARMHLVMSATLAASGALVVVLVIVLSQPFRGESRVSAASFEQVLQAIDVDRVEQ